MLGITLPLHLGLRFENIRCGQSEGGLPPVYQWGCSGVIEAKPEGATLSGALQQAERYRASLPDNLRSLAGFPFSYASTGVETYFRDTRDPNSRSRPILHSIHRRYSLTQATESRTLRERLRDDLPPLERGSLRNCQFEAITNLEESLKAAHPRALIQMATGSGKTYAAVSAAYRLIKFAKVKRVLFLVDRRNLGRQALREFQAYTPPDDNSRFTDSIMFNTSPATQLIR